MKELATAKSLQSCPTLCDPIDGSHQAPHPWDSPSKNTEGLQGSESILYDYNRDTCHYTFVETHRMHTKSEH